MSAPLRYPRLEIAADVDGAAWLRAVLGQLDATHPRVRRARQERNTQQFWVDASDDRAACPLFAKRYAIPFSRNLGTLFLRGRARREFQASRRAFALGIPAIPAIALGERRTLGIVVDQLVAFRDAGDCISTTELLRDPANKGDERKEFRRRLIEFAGRSLRAMHELGVAHLQASPRNLLLRGDPARLDAVWIDWNAAVFFPRSILGGEEALADVLNFLENERLFASEGRRRAFFEAYGGDLTDFAARAEASRGDPAASAAATRRVKLRALLAARGTIPPR
jgi:hypothetical protein